MVRNLLGDLDEHHEDDDDKQIVEDAHSSDEDVRDFQHLVTDVGEVTRHILRRLQGRRDVVRDDS